MSEFSRCVVRFSANIALSSFPKSQTLSISFGNLEDTYKSALEIIQSKGFTRPQLDCLLPAKHLLCVLVAESGGVNNPAPELKRSVKSLADQVCRSWSLPNSELARFFTGATSHEFHFRLNQFAKKVPLEAALSLLQKARIRRLLGEERVMGSSRTKSWEPLDVIRTMEDVGGFENVTVRRGKFSSKLGSKKKKTAGQNDEDQPEHQIHQDAEPSQPSIAQQEMGRGVPPLQPAHQDLSLTPAEGDNSLCSDLGGQDEDMVLASADRHSDSAATPANSVMALDDVGFDGFVDPAEDSTFQFASVCDGAGNDKHDASDDEDNDTADIDATKNSVAEASVVETDHGAAEVGDRINEPPAADVIVDAASEAASQQAAVSSLSAKEAIVTGRKRSHIDNDPVQPRSDATPKLEADPPLGALMCSTNKRAKMDFNTSLQSQAGPPVQPQAAKLPVRITIPSSPSPAPTMQQTYHLRNLLDPRTHKDAVSRLYSVNRRINDQSVAALTELAMVALGGDNFVVLDPAVVAGGTALGNSNLVQRILRALKAETPLSLLLPIHVAGKEHWILGRVLMGRRTVEIWDSMGADGKDARAVVDAALSRWITPTAVHSGQGPISPGPVGDYKSWPTILRSCPQQQNGIDCGIHMIVTFLYILSGNPLPQQLDTRLWRRFICHLLVNAANNIQPSKEIARTLSDHVANLVLSSRPRLHNTPTPHITSAAQVDRIQKDADRLRRDFEAYQAKTAAIRATLSDMEHILDFLVDKTRRAHHEQLQILRSAEQQLKETEDWARHKTESVRSALQSDNSRVGGEESQLRFKNLDREVLDITMDRIKAATDKSRADVEQLRPRKERLDHAMDHLSGVSTALSKAVDALASDEVDKMDIDRNAC